MAMTTKPTASAVRFGARRTTPMAEINVTPLVDVMLVLLVIFMITAPLLATGVQIDLPAAKSGALSDQDAPLAISVDRQGRVFLQDNEVRLSDLAAKLTAIKVARPDVRVFVRGDQGIAYGQVMAVLAAAHAAGLQRVALLTQAPDEPRPRGASSRAAP